MIHQKRGIIRWLSNHVFSAMGTAIVIVLCIIALIFVIFGR
jgi:hypothetical protein